MPLLDDGSHSRKPPIQLPSARFHPAHSRMWHPVKSADLTVARPLPVCPVPPFQPSHPHHDSFDTTFPIPHSHLDGLT